MNDRSDFVWVLDPTVQLGLKPKIQSNGPLSYRVSVRQNVSIKLNFY